MNSGVKCNESDLGTLGCLFAELENDMKLTLGWLFAELENDMKLTHPTLEALQVGCIRFMLFSSSANNMSHLDVCLSFGSESDLGTLGWLFAELENDMKLTHHPSVSFISFSNSANKHLSVPKSNLLHSTPELTRI